MSEERTPRQIVLDMEPVLRNVRDGVDAAVGLGSSDRYNTGEPNGLAYIADSLERHVNLPGGLFDLAAQERQTYWEAMEALKHQGGNVVAGPWEDGREAQP